jgi:hypothetical protein
MVPQMKVVFGNESSYLEVDGRKLLEFSIPIAQQPPAVQAEYDRAVLVTSNLFQSLGTWKAQLVGTKVVVESPISFSLDLAATPDVLKGQVMGAGLAVLPWVQDNALKVTEAFHELIKLGSEKSQLFTPEILGNLKTFAMSKDARRMGSLFAKEWKKAAAPAVAAIKKTAKAQAKKAMAALRQQA